MIKYLGSKRRLVPVLETMAVRSGAATAVDLFTGTTRVAQAFKRRGIHTTAVDSATYAEVLAQCYIATDRERIDTAELEAAVAALDALPGEPGYFTETFCVRSRFFQPRNGERVDAIRDRIERDFVGSPLYPILLTSLMEAADRVDSTTGVHMAYVKQWAPRAEKRMELRVPDLLDGDGAAIRGDALLVTGNLPPVDLAYLDPPYNQHRYFTNYHIWETLVRWDAPEHYGVACKRIDARDPATKSVFNRKREMPGALASVIRDIDAGIVMLSYNDESWVHLDELVGMMAERGHVEVMAFDSQRYVGARIGIHNPDGEKVGTVSHTRNTEYVLVAGDRARVEHVCAGIPVASPK
jgi:adenine-specific DNA-methyltransferase